MGITKEEIESIDTVAPSGQRLLLFDPYWVAELKRLALLGHAVQGVLDHFQWDHAVVRAEVESDRLAETVEGCLMVAIERAIRPADFVPAPVAPSKEEEDESE